MRGESRTGSRRDCPPYGSGERPSAIHLAAVVFDTPQITAAARTDPPGTSINAGRVLGLPSRFPCALARCRPASTRSLIRSRSNSARAAKMCNCSLPAGVVQSIPSPRLTNATPTACKSSGNVTRWRRLRPEPVQTPTDQHVKAPTLGIADQRIEDRAPVLGARYTPVHELCPGPASSLDVVPKLLELVLGFLIERADPRVDRRTDRAAGTEAAHDCASGSDARPAFTIASAALKIRCADRSGIGSAPRRWFHAWMYPRQ